MATIIVSSGVTSSGVVLNNGDVMEIRGGTAINTIANSGGHDNVSSGGLAVSTTVNAVGA